jgi:tetratricopeptide (TPR) repeat protein
VRAAAARRKVALSNTLTAKADTLFENKQYDEAIATYRDALVQNPANTGATEGLSDVLTAKGIAAAGAANDLSGAEFLNEAVKQNRKNAVAYAKLGEIYDTHDDSVKAVQNYEAALAADPGLTDLYVPLGIAYIKTGEVAKAGAIAAKAEALGPESAELRYLRGLVQFRENKNDQALASFDRAITLDSDLITAYYYRGQVLDRMERKDQAIASYKQTITKDPTFAPAWYEMGVVSYNTGDYNGAANAYQEAVKYDPANGEAHANLASSYRQLEKYPEANKEYWEASNTIKGNADLHSEWGYCLGKTNEWDKAIKQTTVAQEISPTAVDYTNVGWAYYNAAEGDKQANNNESAAANYQIGKAFLQKAVETNPKLDAAYMNLGSTYNALGEYQAAVDTLNQAVNLRKDWVIALNQLGVGYRGLKNYSAAAAQFNRVVSLDGTNLSGLFYLGEVQYTLGNKKEARKIQQKLSTLNSKLGNRLDRILDGKEVLDDATRRIRDKIPLPKFPF